jgi:hypothetical protein
MPHTISHEEDSKLPTRIALKFRVVPGAFAVCRFPPDATLPDWALAGPISSVTRTLDELSIVCLADDIPANVTFGPRWTCFKLEGPFAFTQVGILASFLAPLSANGIPIFAISTYDTDYVLVSEGHEQLSLQALKVAGHELVR